VVAFEKLWGPGNGNSVISIKVDPLQIQAIKKVAAMKSIPYQILIRHWLSQNLKEELQIK
jgi:predicted DNA binding CopG/RHH family protein